MRTHALRSWATADRHRIAIAVAAPCLVLAVSCTASEPVSTDGGSPDATAARDAGARDASADVPDAEPIADTGFMPDADADAGVQDTGRPDAGGCGDGVVADGERCDDAGNNGQPGMCNATCSGVTPVQESAQLVHFPRLSNDTAPTHYRVLLVLVDTVGGLVDDPRTEVLEMYEPRELGELFFVHPHGTDAFYREASYGEVSLSGSVVGWLESFEGEVSADEMFEARDSYFELATPHIDYGDYDVVVLVGMAHTGGRQTGWRFGNTITVSEGRYTVGIIYMINSTVLRAVTDRRYGGTILPAKPWPHELGHTLGLGHATSIWCTDAVFCEDPEVHAYGDIFNYMGAGEFASHPDVLQKLRLGWLTDAQVPQLTPGIDTEVTLYPLAVDDGRVKGARIALSTPQVGRDLLAVEYRTPVGFDAYLNRLQDPSFKDIFTTETIDSVGLQLRVSSSAAQGEFTSLLDLHPSTPYNPSRGVYTNGNPGKMADAFLNVGESFSDTVNRYTLTNRGPSGDGGMVLSVTWN